MTEQAQTISVQRAGAAPWDAPHAVSLETLGWVEHELTEALRLLRGKAGTQAKEAQEAQDAGDIEYASWPGRRRG